MITTLPRSAPALPSLAMGTYAKDETIPIAGARGGRRSYCRPALAAKPRAKALGNFSKRVAIMSRAKPNSCSPQGETGDSPLRM